MAVPLPVFIPRISRRPPGQSYEHRKAPAGRRSGAGHGSVVFINPDGHRGRGPRNAYERQREGPGKKRTSPPASCQTCPAGMNEKVRNGNSGGSGSPYWICWGASDRTVVFLRVLTTFATPTPPMAVAHPNQKAPINCQNQDSPNPAITLPSVPAAGPVSCGSPSRTETSGPGGISRRKAR